MAKIAMIGAGGYVFPLRLIGDILAFPELQDSTLALMDIDAGRLARTANAARELIKHHNLPAKVEETTDRRAALDGAKYVIITFQVGGIDAFRLDVEIPRKYGIDQTVGDTLGPGGVFRGLRTIPVLMEIARDMRELCPDALCIQYANPMAINCWTLSDCGVKTVGLCHSVQGTSMMLAKSIDVPYEQVIFRSAGINHQAWFIEFKRRFPDGHEEDLYPLIKNVMFERHLAQRDRTLATTMAVDRGDHSDANRPVSNYEGGQEAVRSEIMRSFGYFHTESSHHASEYVPYFRKNPDTVQSYIANRWDYYQICTSHDESGHTGELLDRLKEKLVPSHEYGAFIIHSIETRQPRVIYGNVPNNGLIDNLPEGSCVEVACLVDGAGLQPTKVGKLPPQCAALNRTNINVQELTVKAGMEGDPDSVYYAVQLDPLTGALLTLPEIRRMVGEMLEAESQWLPQFCSK